MTRVMTFFTCLIDSSNLDAYSIEKDETPDRIDNACQEIGMHILRGFPMGPQKERLMNGMKNRHYST
jgi:hypothetical protein